MSEKENETWADWYKIITVAEKSLLVIIAGLTVYAVMAEIIFILIIIIIELRPTFMAGALLLSLPAPLGCRAAKTQRYVCDTVPVCVYMCMRFFRRQQQFLTTT